MEVTENREGSKIQFIDRQNNAWIHYGIASLTEDDINANSTDSETEVLDAGIAKTVQMQVSQVSGDISAAEITLQHSLLPEGPFVSTSVAVTGAGMSDHLENSARYIKAKVTNAAGTAGVASVTITAR